MATKWYGSKWISPWKRLACYMRDGFRCVYCGKNLKGAAPHDVTLDHLVPRSAGGGNDATNCMTACGACNYSRQDKPWREFASSDAIERIQALRFQPLNIKLAKAIMAGTAGDPAIESER